jgi:hypothetical protein
MKANLEGKYVTNITNEGWMNTLKFRIRVATTLDRIYLLNRTAEYNITPNETLEKHLSQLSTVITVISQDRCSRTGIIGIAGSTQLDHRPRATHEIVKLLKQEASFDIAPDKFILLSGKAQFPDDMDIPTDFIGCAEQVNCLVILSDEDIASDLRRALLSIDMPTLPNGFQEIWNYTFFPLFPTDENEGKQLLRGIERQCTYITDTIRIEIKGIKIDMFTFIPQHTASSGRPTDHYTTPIATLLMDKGRVLQKNPSGRQCSTPFLRIHRLGSDRWVFRGPYHQFYEIEYYLRHNFALQMKNWTSGLVDPATEEVVTTCYS